MENIHAVTGAFGYSGKYIAARLIESGHRVITLTNSVNRSNPFGEKLEVFPFNFNKPDELVKSLQGVSVLYNTYWIRFNHKLFNHSEAVENTIVLFNAARKAGVKKIVHVSITNPSEDSDLEYFSGKARLEKHLMQLGISYTILRPTVLFGKEDILINNIAWALRKLPVIGVFGDGQYRLQPIYVDDLAELAVNRGEILENEIIDAIGPETFTYRELIEKIGEIIGKNRKIVSVSPGFGYFACSLMGKFVGDIIITREEIKGLMADLLYVKSPPAGNTKLTDWIREHAQSLGKNYTGELIRRKDLKSGYRSN